MHLQNWGAADLNLFASSSIALANLSVEVDTSLFFVKTSATFETKTKYIIVLLDVIIIIRSENKTNSY